jgi:glycosyltransferase 2 family protein
MNRGERTRILRAPVHGPGTHRFQQPCFQFTAGMRNSFDGQRRLSRIKAVVLWVIALLIAAVLLRYSLRGIDWKRVGALLVGARWHYVALGLFISTVSLTLRALRWRLLLCAGGNVPVGTAFWATAAGYFGNSFLPARAGELVRTLMISSRSTLSKAYVLTTALSERVSDAIALVVISATVLTILPYKPGWLADASKPFAAAAFVALLAIALLPRLEPVAERVVTRMPLSSTIQMKLIQLLESCLQGLRSFHDLRRLSGFLGMTAVIWTLDALGSVVAAKALGLSMPLSVAFLLIAGLGLASAVPSTPGYVGVYQFVAVSILVPFGFSRTNAIAYILFAQALSYALVGFWGALGLLRYRRLKIDHDLPITSPHPLRSN